MLSTPFIAEKIHGLFFDGATLLGNFAFFGFLPTLEDEVNPTFAGAILLVAVVTQMTGAWWKKGFLTQRLARRTRPPARGFARGFMNFLLFFHFLLITVITLFALAQVGIYDFGDSGSFYKGDVWVVVSLLVGTLTMFLVISYVFLSTQPLSLPSGGLPTRADLVPDLGGNSAGGLAGDHRLKELSQKRKLPLEMFFVAIL